MIRLQIQIKPFANDKCYGCQYHGTTTGPWGWVPVCRLFRDSAGRPRQQSIGESGPPNEPHQQRMDREFRSALRLPECEQAEKAFVTPEAIRTAATSSR